MKYTYNILNITLIPRIRRHTTLLQFRNNVELLGQDLWQSLGAVLFKKNIIEYHKRRQGAIFEICFAFISLQKIPSKDHEAIHTDILKEKYRSKEDILKELYRPKEDLIKDNCGFCEK